MMRNSEKGMTTVAIARMKVILARVVGESDIAEDEGESGEVWTLRTILAAAALLLEEHDRHPVKELLAATAGVNASGSAPASLDLMQSFLAARVEDHKVWP